MKAAAAALGKDGVFAHRLQGFVARPAQQAMAGAVEAALAAESTLMVEAGTGTGKTYAYLAPVLLSGKRAVISTGTKNLQDQLFHRDLPKVRDALASPARVALLKGRGNYLCLYRLERAQREPQQTQRITLAELQQWAQQTVSGELAETRELSPALKARVTSTADNCLGRKCPDFDRCFVFKARKEAMAADLVVVNHHLLFADFRLKEEGFSVLPGVEAVVIDEAHQLPDLAPQFFGERLSTRQLVELTRDIHAEILGYGDMPDLSTALQQLTEAVHEIGTLFHPFSGRRAWDEFMRAEGAEEIHGILGEALQRVLEQLRTVSARGVGLSQLADRTALVQAHWQMLLAPEPPNGWVRWAEAVGRGGAWHAAPVESAESFGRLFAAYPGSWIFTSATLSARSNFEDFRAALGLPTQEALRVDSPFDFTRQARLYLPSGLPDPNSEGFIAAVAESLLPVIEASGGGAFVLCTSYRALQGIAEILRRRDAATYGPVLAQGDDDKAALLERFSAAGDAVLVATSSFWEGVDVKGAALRVVAIDKLPFPAQGDPLYEARLQAIRRAGGNPFNDYQLPRTMLTLRQGVGRLIRDAADRGLIVLCDPRLRSRGYGRRVLASLPPIPRVEGLEAARDWLASLEAA